jgi:hypothetical protein
MRLDQFGGPAHGLTAQVATELSDDLGAQQRNLLTALDFDPFSLNPGLHVQLLGDPYRVGTCLVDDVPRLVAAFFKPLGVELVGSGQSLGGLGAVVQLSANGIFLFVHQLADWRDHELGDDPDYDREADQLSDEC